MYNLLKGEFYKISKSKITYIVGALIMFYAIAQVAIVGFYSQLEGGIQFLYGEDTVSGIKCFLASTSGDILYVLMGIYVSTLIYTEYFTRSIGQIISKGYSKTKVLLSKYIATAAINVLLIAIYAIVVLIGASVIGESGYTRDLAEYIIAFIIGNIIMILSYSALSTLFAYYFKGTMVGIIFNIMFLFMGALGLQLIEIFTQKFIYYQYWLSAMSATFGDVETDLSKQYMFMGIFIIIAIVSIAGSVSLINKRDID